DGTLWTVQEFAYTPANTWGTVWAQVAAGGGGGGTCDVPSGLGAIAITATSATLQWGLVSAATSYNVQYRAVGAPLWISASTSGTTLPVSNLTSSTQYEFQVQSVCSGGTSAFSASFNFTTLSTNSCSDSYEPNNTQTTPAAIPVNTDILSMIATNS